ncbi:MAP/microtubule affinity-regulating kinase 4-like [Bombina bombina]|uniref:MAP/microtubule affinity-regulating kinase 4-like n=1 Tax=Bombina bombina TaxID=8345 RepID=UPI00235A9B25|nr:MAP/microtubule affinity-regulating kinase 4-like [Bombina bombina]
MTLERRCNILRKIDPKISDFASNNMSPDDNGLLFGDSYLKELNQSGRQLSRPSLARISSSSSMDDLRGPWSLRGLSDGARFLIQESWAPDAMASNNRCFGVCRCMLACSASVITCDLFIGDYYVLDTLGKGGFGVVKRARHMRTGREVAIKIINKANRNSAHLRKLYQEVTIMQMLDHPNIAKSDPLKFYEVIDSKDKLYIVMEYVSGGNLQNYLINNGPMEEKKARHIFRQMVSALHYCHQKYVAHRDVKSMSVLIDSEGNIKIADFGISSIYNPGIKMARYSGTPTHFPPEYYLRLKYYGPEVDVWCLGVVLYQMVTGTLPFNKLYQEDFLDSSWF